MYNVAAGNVKHLRMSQPKSRGHKVKTKDQKSRFLSLELDVFYHTNILTYLDMHYYHPKLNADQFLANKEVTSE